MIRNQPPAEQAVSNGRYIPGDYEPAVVHLTTQGAPVIFDDEGRAESVQREVCGRVQLLECGWLHVYTDDWAPGGTGELLLPPASVSRVELMR